jgi:hypothetical protein
MIVSQIYDEFGIANDAAPEPDLRSSQASKIPYPRLMELWRSCWSDRFRSLDSLNPTRKGVAATGTASPSSSASSHRMGSSRSSTNSVDDAGTAAAAAAGAGDGGSQPTTGGST